MNYVLSLNQITKEDVDLVGVKGANLGEVKRLGVSTPDGFVLTSKAYSDFLNKNDISGKIGSILSTLDFKNTELLNEISNQVKKLVQGSFFPEDTELQIRRAYLNLLKSGTKHVAVRSSAISEDLAEASFAGQFATFLNVASERQLMDSIKKCWGSLYSPRALLYREERGLGQAKIGIAVLVQAMVQSEVSGVMFTIDPVTNNKSRVVIEAGWGLGNLMVQSIVTPDHFEIAKQNFTIINKKISTQEKQLVLTDRGDKEIPVSKEFKDAQKISDEDLIKLAKIGKEIENFYLFPQDIEWALEEGKIFILQSRPVTTTSVVINQPIERFRINLPVLVKGAAASPGIRQGFAKVVRSEKEFNKVKPHDILIIKMSQKNYFPAIKKALAIVTDRGGKTSHLAIVSRELGIPCVVDTMVGTKVIKNGVVITVNGSNGIVYRGSLPVGKLSKLIAHYEVKSDSSENLQNKPKTATKIFVNLTDANFSSETSQLNVDGVGLLRSEFMISEIGVHPNKLIEEKKEKFIVDKLVGSLKTAAASFDPNPVIYRACDFTSGEFAQLKGGSKYELSEVNPLIGYRGSARFINNPNLFNLEIEAIKVVRNVHNLKNLWFSIPFVRSLEEMQKIKRIISAAGLYRSPSFKLLMIIETPASVALIEKFFELGIDGISIDLANLRSLMLAADSRSEKLSKTYSEEDPAIIWALERVLAECRKNKAYSLVYGHNPQESPALTEIMVGWGINAISVSPELVGKVREIVYESEKRLVTHRKK